MNLLEHYVIEIYSEEDVTCKFKEKCGYAPAEKLFAVDMLVDCCGIRERVCKNMFESELWFMKQNGFYMG